MIKKIMYTIATVAIIVVLIKVFPVVNDLAQSYVPSEILSLIGEEPKGIFEKSANEIGNTLNNIFK